MGTVPQIQWIPLNRKTLFFELLVGLIDVVWYLLPTDVSTVKKFVIAIGIFCFLNLCFVARAIYVGYQELRTYAVNRDNQIANEAEATTQRKSIDEWVISLMGQLVKFALFRGNQLFATYSVFGTTAVVDKQVLILANTPENLMGQLPPGTNIMIVDRDSFTVLGVFQVYSIDPTDARAFAQPILIRNQDWWDQLCLQSMVHRMESTSALGILI